ncbi:hypothetical protein OB905_11715 [Halobacteria archaeon AArc-dxtr1]|nr:hypothetical protein [Halobacteria archaeon AArc-dxtr1]
MDPRRIEMMISELEEAQEEFEQSVRNTREAFREIKDTLESELEEESVSFEEEVSGEIKEVHEDLTEIMTGEVYCEITITGGKKDEEGNIYRNFKNPAIKARAKKDGLNIKPSTLAEELDKRDRKLVQEMRRKYDGVQLVCSQAIEG